MNVFVLLLFLTVKLLQESSMVPILKVVDGWYLTIAVIESPILDVA